MGNVKISQLKMGVYGASYRRPYTKAMQPKQTTIANGKLPYEVCAQCGLKIVGVPFTECQRCGAILCRKCTNGNLKACPKCGFKGS